MTLDDSSGKKAEASESSERVTELADQLHEDWRATRRQEHGTFEPRMKTTNDATWIEQHGGEADVDIANTRYRDLPSDWQAENQASAEVAIREVERAIRRGENLDENFVEKASSSIHDAWLSRNGSWAPPEQNRPYGELSEDEKEKDRVIVRRAIAICSRTT